MVSTMSCVFIPVGLNFFKKWISYTKTKITVVYILLKQVLFEEMFKQDMDITVGKDPAPFGKICFLISLNEVS